MQIHEERHDTQARPTSKLFMGMEPIIAYIPIAAGQVTRKFGTYALSVCAWIVSSPWQLESVAAIPQNSCKDVRPRYR